MDAGGLLEGGFEVGSSVGVDAGGLLEGGGREDGGGAGVDDGGAGVGVVWPVPVACRFSPWWR